MRQCCNKPVQLSFDFDRPQLISEYLTQIRPQEIAALRERLAQSLTAEFVRRFAETLVAESPFARLFSGKGVSS